MNETFEVGGLLFEVRRSSRRKTLGLTVDRHGELLVHAPEGEPTTRIEAWVRAKLLWVHRRLAAKERLASAWRDRREELDRKASEVFWCTAAMGQ
jgi:predicted metal-dependent hydrolase